MGVTGGATAVAGGGRGVTDCSSGLTEGYSGVTDDSCNVGQNIKCAESTEGYGPDLIPKSREYT